MKILAAVLFLGVCPLSSRSAWAGSRDLVVESSGVGGSSEDAAPYVETFSRYAEKKLGWPANSANGRYFSDRAAAIAYIASTRPGFGMIDPALWLDMQKKQEMEVLVAVSGKNETLGHFSIVVKNPLLQSLADLKGKTLVSNHLDSPEFLSRVVFDGKIQAASYFKLEPTTSPLRGLKAVDRNEADGALVDDDQLASMKSLPFGAALRVVYTSPELPPMPLVAFVKNTTPAERQAMTKMLLGMCRDSKGAEVCKSLQISQFSPPNKGAFDAALRRYGK